MNASLDTELLCLLNERKGDWQRVARTAGVSYSWLTKFAQGRIPNPGYMTLKRLHSALLLGDPKTREAA